MESCSLQELKEHFESKIECLTKCMDLAAEVIGLGAPEAECREQLVAINSELCLAESAVGQLREHIREQRKQLQEAELVKEQIADLVSHVRHAEAHLPERLPGQKPQQQSVRNVPENHRAPLIPKQVTNNTNQERSASTAKPAGFKKKHYVPQMEYLTVEEFNSIPKYMKGRLAYDNINSMVDGINLTVTTKYNLMRKSTATLPEAKRKKYFKYKEQENKNTKGIFFFIDEDFKSYSKLKYDSTARSIVTILRHSGRLREIRGGGLTRFAII